VALVALGEDRTAGMGEQHLEPIGTSAEEQDAGADSHRPILEPTTTDVVDGR